jgi:formiminotetrahydrofolate cyclodeaminase
MTMELIERTVKEFLEELASDAPAPGGGSAAALACAEGAALACMVGKLTIGKKKFLALPEEERSAFIGAAASFEPLRERFATLVDEDASSFDAVMEAFRLPKGTPEEIAVRTAAVTAAYRGAIAVPMRTAENAAAGIARLSSLLKNANRTCISDLGVAALLLSAGLAGAVMNIEINLSGIPDECERGLLRTKAAEFLKARGEAEAIVAAVRSA